MIAIVPGYISRSVAGSYDNEGIAIFCMLSTYYLWIRVCVLSFISCLRCLLRINSSPVCKKFYLYIFFQFQFGKISRDAIAEFYKNLDT